MLEPLAFELSASLLGCEARDNVVIERIGQRIELAIVWRWARRVVRVALACNKAGVHHIFLPLLRHCLQLRTARGEQYHAGASGEVDARQVPRTWYDDRPADVVGRLRFEPVVPAEAALDDAGGELLTVHRAEHVAAGLAMHEAVEPHVVDPVLEVRFVE